MFCEKMHECTVDKTTDSDNDGIPNFEESWGKTVADCETMRLNGYEVNSGGAIIPFAPLNCDSATLDNACDDDPSGSSYDAASAAQCIDDSRAMSCADFTSPSVSEPEACSKTCS